MTKMCPHCGEHREVLKLVRRIWENEFEKELAEVEERAREEVEDQRDKAELAWKALEFIHRDLGKDTGLNYYNRAMKHIGLSL